MKSVRKSKVTDSPALKQYGRKVNLEPTFNVNSKSSNHGESQLERVFEDIKVK